MMLFPFAALLFMPRRNYGHFAARPAIHRAAFQPTAPCLPKSIL